MGRNAFARFNAISNSSTLEQLRGCSGRWRSTYHRFLGYGTVFGVFVEGRAREKTEV